MQFLTRNSLFCYNTTKPESKRIQSIFPRRPSRHQIQKLNWFIESSLFTGRGKTFLLNAVVNYVRGLGHIALCCASSGFAAALYPGGRTAHNLFKIDVVTERDCLTKVQCSVSANSQRAELLRKAKLVIWDEFAAAHRENFEAVDTMLRVIRKNPDVCCGGLLFIGSGDFRQIPPIIQNGSVCDRVRASIKFSPLWKEFNVVKLTLPMRQSRDENYRKYVKKVLVRTIFSHQKVFCFKQK